jgi:hypothetical protein
MYSTDSPASVSIHEEAAVFAEGPMMGAFNNLVMHHQHVLRRGEPHGTTTARAEQHLLRIDRRLAPRRCGRERCGGSQTACHPRRVTSATIAGQDAAKRVFQPGMNAERPRQQNVQAAGGGVGFDQRAVCRPRGLTIGQRRLATLGVVVIWVVIKCNTRH